MTRRGDSERIYAAQRAGIFRRLVTSERINELDPRHWINRWERQAEREGVDWTEPDFWATGRLWIAEQRRRR